MRVRTRGRELALQFLFQLDFQGAPYLGELGAFLDEELGDHREAAEVASYARRLVEGVARRREEVDQRIAAAATNWDVGRMAAVDRAALRLGTYELLYADDVPTRVAINEAIELAKRFSTESSGAFVNGILDRIRKDAGVAR